MPWPDRPLHQCTPSCQYTRPGWNLQRAYCRRNDRTRLLPRLHKVYPTAPCANNQHPRNHALDSRLRGLAVCRPVGTEVVLLLSVMAYGINILDRFECPSRQERPPVEAVRSRKGRRRLSRTATLQAASKTRLPLIDSETRAHIGDRTGRGRPGCGRSTATRSTWIDPTDPAET